MVVSGRFERGPGKRVDARGRVLNEIHDIAASPVRVGLLWQRGHWLVADMSLSPSGQ